MVVCFCLKHSGRLLPGVPGIRISRMSPGDIVAVRLCQLEQDGSISGSP
jgi:hypothetical protein